MMLEDSINYLKMKLKIVSGLAKDNYIPVGPEINF